MAEIQENCPGVKIVLTALKCDLRKDEEQNENPNAISFEEGLSKAKEIGAVKYLGTVATFWHDTSLANCLQSALPFKTGEFERASTKQPRLRSRSRLRDRKEAARNALFSKSLDVDPLLGDLVSSTVPSPPPSAYSI